MSNSANGTPASQRTGAMRQGRQADSARRRQRVIAALNRASGDGTEITASGIARAAGVDRSFLYRHRDLLGKIHALEAAPPAVGDHAAGPGVTRASLQADLLRHTRTRAPAERARPAARETPLRSTRRAGLARVRARHARRPRRPHPEDQPSRAASRRPAAAARRTRPGPRRGPGRQPRAHGPAQHHTTTSVTRHVSSLHHTCRGR